jgi:hypothetical protein
MSTRVGEGFRQNAGATRYVEHTSARDDIGQGQKWLRQ